MVKDGKSVSNPLNPCYIKIPSPPAKNPCSKKTKPQAKKIRAQSVFYQNPIAAGE